MYILDFFFFFLNVYQLGFTSGSSDSKESSSNVGDLGWIPGLGRFPGEGNGNPLQYSCLENSMDRGAWRSTVHGGPKELDMTERLTHQFSNLGTQMYRTEFWTLWEKARVGCFERTASKHVYYLW